MSSKVTKAGNNKIPPTFNEFKDLVLKGDLASSSSINTSADFYDNMPSIIRMLHNLDPTGISSVIDQILTNDKDNREQDNILRAIYLLAQAIQTSQEELSNLKRDYLSAQIPLLTHSYFHNSKTTFHQSKIELFRNIWLNGLLDTDRREGEKQRIFTLVASMTEDEISVLKFLHKTFISGTNQEPPNIEDIANNLGIDSLYAQQLCLGLQSYGLVVDWANGKLNANSAVQFIITGYTYRLVSYITDLKHDE